MDRIDRLQETADRLGQDLAALRRELAVLREEAGRVTPVSPAGEPPTGERGVEPASADSRIDVMNAAFARASADPSPVPRVAPGGPATPFRTWGELLETLGVRGAPAAPGRPVAPPAARRGLEDLIGRYGTIALASLTILLGIGALIGWAIRNGYIGPMVRVAIGLVIAAVLAVAGWRVRRGDSPRFGNALLALALAVVHVVSWGAGPRLHLISVPAVLGLAALASAALAALAWREDDQVLFNVGFGGALLAPFVTSDGGGHAVMLLSYGFVVLGAGIASLGQRSWPRAPMVAVLGIIVYAATGASLASGAESWAVRSAAGAFALGLSGLASVLLEGRKRMAITYPALLTALGAMTAVADGPTLNRGQYPFALVLLVATRFAGEAALRGLRTGFVGGVVLPLGATALALGTLDPVVGLAGAGTALLFAGFAAAATWADVTGDRRIHAFTAALLVGLAVALLSDKQQWLFCVMMAGFGLTAALVTRRLQLGGIGLAGAAWLAVATGAAFDLIADRPAYAYTPFLTQASLAAGAVSAAWLFLSFHTSRHLAPGSRLAATGPRTVLRVLGGVVTFFWIRQELARAVSPDVSAFLVIAWYAVSGVASIFLGRARTLPVLRQVGLGLSVLAALTTITQASSLAIGWRVGSYLLAGVFLLGVAWSYRVTRAAAPDATPAANA